MTFTVCRDRRAAPWTSARSSVARAGGGAAIEELARPCMAASASELPIEDAASSAASVARASAFNLIARLASGASAFGLTVLTTHLLDTEGRGVYAIIATWTGIAVMDMSQSSTVLNADLIHKRRDERLLHGAASAIALFSGLFLLAVYGAISAAGHRGRATGAADLDDGVSGASDLFVLRDGDRASARRRQEGGPHGHRHVGCAPRPDCRSRRAPRADRHRTHSGVGCGGAHHRGGAVPVGAQSREHVILRCWRLGLGIMRRSVRVALSDSIVLLCARIDLLVVAAVLGTSAAGICLRSPLHSRRLCCCCRARC